MIKKVIPYTDFDGNPRVEEFWFNLTKAEMMDLGLSKDGGYDKYMEQLMHSTKVGEAIEVFKKILLLAYGKKSLDGRKFEKSPEITADFVATQAYSDLYVELAIDPDKAAEFMNGVMGADVRKMVAENEAKAKAAEVSAAVAANNARALAVANPMYPSQAASCPALPKGEPLANRETFDWTRKARHFINGSALLQRAGFIETLS